MSLTYELSASNEVSTTLGRSPQQNIIIIKLHVTYPAASSNAAEIDQTHEVRLDGLKWDLSCVCGSLRWGAGSTRGAAIQICAKNENREKREKRSQGICGFWESQAKGYAGFVRAIA